MRLVDIVLCILCVGIASVGQLLLRLTSASAARSTMAWPWSLVNGTTVLAILVYLAAMLLWMFVLSRVPLTQAFAFFGLTFLLVPLLAHFFAGDPVSMKTWIGGALVMAGVAVSNWRT